MNENEEKLELIRAMTAVEIRPEQAEEELAARSYEKLPLSRLMALGTGLEPIVSAVQYVLSNGEASTIQKHWRKYAEQGSILALYRMGSTLQLSIRSQAFWARM